MLTKTELNQKKAKSEQLDLVETISTDDKSQKKRQLLYIALFTTIGLSFIFWSYRQISTLKFEFKLPTLPAPSSSVDDPVSRLTSLDPNKWTVTVYQDNFPATDFKNNSSFTKNILPQGLDIKENYTESSSTITLNSLITTPQKQMLFSIIIEGNNVAQSKELLSKVVSELYWSNIKD